jgi:hypothetical protein
MPALRRPRAFPIWVAVTDSPANLAVNRPFNCEYLSSALRTTFSKAVALAPSELFGVWRRGERGWHMIANSVLHRSVFAGKSQRGDAIAGVMVLSEVARRLMMISGSGASTCAAGYGRAATSQPIDRGHHDHRPSGTSPARRTGPGTSGYVQAGFAWPQSNDVPSTQMQ